MLFWELWYTWNAHDNFAVQNSDLVISVGARLDTKATGTPVTTFARAAKKIMVDIDINEIKKFEHFKLKLDLEIECDSRDFVLNAREVFKLFSGSFENWIDTLCNWKDELEPIEREFRASEDSLPIYDFFTYIGGFLDNDCQIVSDTMAQVNVSVSIQKNSNVLS